MAIYILVLSIVPCSDTHNLCNKKAKTELSKGHSHEDDKDDACSPFCTCSCCGTHVALIDTPIYSITIQQTYILADKVTLRNVSFVATFFNNIWQPPKITA